MPARKIVHLDKPTPRNHSDFCNQFSEQLYFGVREDRVAQPPPAVLVEERPFMAAKDHSLPLSC